MNSLPDRDRPASAVQAVLFDLDGLIVDSEPLHQEAFNRLLQRHGIPYHLDDEEYGRCFVGIPVSQNAALLSERFPWKKPVAELIRERESIYEGLISRPANLTPYPGLDVVLEEIGKRQLRAAVASGSPRHHARMVLQGLGIDSCFSVVLGGNDVPRKKPMPDVYLRALELLDLPPSACIALEDSATGVAAAKAAGLRVFVIPNRYTLHQDLSSADVRLSGLVELLPYLGGR